MMVLLLLIIVISWLFVCLFSNFIYHNNFVEMHLSVKFRYLKWMSPRCPFAKQTHKNQCRIIIFLPFILTIQYFWTKFNASYQAQRLLRKWSNRTWHHCSCQCLPSYSAKARLNPKVMQFTLVGPYYKQDKVHAFSTVLFEMLGGLRPPRSLNKTSRNQYTLSITFGIYRAR